MLPLGVLVAFSRPHTMMGTFLAVPAISSYVGGGYSFGALPAALSANIFVTGLNQMADIDVDKLNKPRLPLALSLIHI